MSEISPAEWTAILLSLRVAVIATLVATPFGIALAWLLARREFWGKSILDALVHGEISHERAGLEARRLVEREKKGWLRE